MRAELPTLLRAAVKPDMGERFPGGGRFSDKEKTSIAEGEKPAQSGD